MTSKQQLRLERAERVCRLVMRHHSCGLVENEGYCPDVISALHFMETEGEKKHALKPGSLYWLGTLAEQIRKYLFAWMESVGLDPRSYEKQATQRMAMELAQEALGPGYEGEVGQTDEAKKFTPWVEKTADERASGLVQEFASGKVRDHEELRMAIAADILEAEHAARAPFLQYADTIFQACEDARGGEIPGDAQERMKEGTVSLLAEASRWMNLNLSGAAARGKRKVK